MKYVRNINIFKKITFDNGMTVDRFEMKVVIDDLTSYKCPGLN